MEADEGKLNISIIESLKTCDGGLHLPQESEMRDVNNWIYSSGSGRL
jgi:hypothetical protein